MVTAQLAVASRYSRITSMIETGTCVLMDGAIGTELIDVSGARPERDERLWGVTAIMEQPERVKAVHRQYVHAGCDVLCTNTWGLPTALRDPRQLLNDWPRPVHWMDMARQGVQLARRAAEEEGRSGDVAVAFSLNGDIDTCDGWETIRLLTRAFDGDRPDLILMETLSLVRESTYETVRRLLETELPVWLSFRRCRHGVCGVYGEHWGGPEGDAFGRAVRRFEEMGIDALLINCLPPDHVSGMVEWLRDFTDLTLGVYPNLGYLSARGWRSDAATGGAEYANLALGWREEGAQIIGGCCGVGPEHIAAAGVALSDTKPGTLHKRALTNDSHNAVPAHTQAGAPWTDPRGRTLFPLEFPDVLVEPGVFVPTQGSLLVWKYLFRERVGANQRCLDVGCGTGLLTVQLARNGAAHVHAIDIDPAAIDNTMANAFRSGVADRVSAEAADLFPWVPEERYDVIVASLYQMPVDPAGQVSTHRPLDYWGRNLIDHLIARLPSALADDGVAYLMQLSIIGQQRTVELLERLGYSSRVVDFGFFEFHELFKEKSAQIRRVEDSSDAYHLKLGGQDVMVAYLIEIVSRSRAEAMDVSGDDRTASS
jgi:homocysteine S-methyltransferase